MSPYIQIARPHHWFKNIFMLPGVALAVILTGAEFWASLPKLLVAVISACMIASANYVINEWLDAGFDRHHPVKKHRPSAAGEVRGPLVYLEYALLALAGLGLAWPLGASFLTVSVLFLLSGVSYNVPPLRTKDRAYLDALSESVNNPLRLMLGWSALAADAFPPSSILLAYWMGGAFLMTVKRYAEYRFIGDPATAALYRRSFRVYTEEKLLLASFFYALSSAFFLGVFLIKYRIEFLLSFPLFAVLFVWYLHLAMRYDSPVQNPEKLYRERGFIAYTVGLCLAVALLFVLDIPSLDVLTDTVLFDNPWGR